jgi:hypothetical protein
MVTTNYGLAGGTLDSTRLLEAAIPRLLSAPERKAFVKRLELSAAVQPGRANAASN